MAAECLTTKAVLGRLGDYLSPRGLMEHDSDQEEELEACFEVIAHSISEILLDVDHEITRLRRYFTWGDPHASSKLVPVLQDFFIDARFDLRKNRSSVCLMLDCLQSGNLSQATIQLLDQTFLKKPASRQAVVSSMSSRSSRLQPLVAIELYKLSDQLDVRQLFVKYRPKSGCTYKVGSRLTRKLHEAITRCDYNALHKCLSNKVDPNAQLEQWGILPIHRALDQVEGSLTSNNRTTVGASTSIVTALVIAGADLRALDENGRTPLLRAVMNEMPDSLISLMLEFGASANAKDKQRSSALHYAAAKVPSDEVGNAGIIRILLVRGADQSLKNKRGRTPLHDAISSDMFDRARELLDYGADLEVADKNGRTPLLAAVTQGSAPMTKLVCDRGATVDKKDRDGYTALHYAISQGCKEIVEILLDAGADVNLISKGETPLCRAVSKSKLPLVNVLLTHFADVAVPSPSYGDALPIHIAAMGNNLAILDTLLKAGSPINAMDEERRTPLRWAMDGGRNEVVHFLFKEGAAK